MSRSPLPRETIHTTVSIPGLLLPLFDQGGTLLSQLSALAAQRVAPPGSKKRSMRPNRSAWFRHLIDRGLPIYPYNDLQSYESQASDKACDKTPAQRAVLQKAVALFQTREGLHPINIGLTVRQMVLLRQHQYALQAFDWEQEVDRNITCADLVLSCAHRTNELLAELVQGFGGLKNDDSSK